MKRRPEEALFRKLFSAWKAGLPALTVLYGRRYVAEDPNNAIAWLMLASALYETAKYDEAEQAIARAIKLLSPEKRHMGIYQMGHLFAERGNHEQALIWYRRMIEAAPKDPRGYVYLGGVLAMQGRLREAEEVHRAATERCDDKRGLGEAFLNLGLVLRGQERFDEAANSLREALRIDAKNQPAKKALRDVERCLEVMRELV